MTCYLVRDLLPLYIEGDCGKETETFIKRHISNCEECGELYELMKEPIELESENEEVILLETEEKRFQQRYYGLLLIKAACWFGAVFIAMLIIKLLI
ncbi:anti-sigma factor [Bacillus atrophaeus]|uniref:anti-sigma factor family protein n=1 Tax=Bacillus atrophaeus TaxID=1452 RepID=UPI00123BB570|nr:zf-HC2 domain-containing protein [Bacillus atrophaeus]KAA6453696.1 anti-sigma factor [Bacillus atrophaeus]